jgi:hypothetical protein
MCKSYVYIYIYLFFVSYIVSLFHDPNFPVVLYGVQFMMVMMMMNGGDDDATWQFQI